MREREGQCTWDFLLIITTFGNKKDRSSAKWPLPGGLCLEETGRAQLSHEKEQDAS